MPALLIIIGKEEALSGAKLNGCSGSKELIGIPGLRKRIKTRTPLRSFQRHFFRHTYI